MVDRLARREGAFPPRPVVAVALVCLLVAIAALAAPSRSQAEVCADGKEYTFCKTTNSKGTYTLVVPKGDLIAAFEPAFAPYKDCTWFVAVDFGDETSETYTWNAEEGLTASHTFPSPGSYVVKVEATEGTHNGTEEACPDLHLTAYVTYSQPSTPPPPEEPPSKPPGGGETGSPAGGGGARKTAGPTSGATPGEGGAGTLYWRRCAGGVLAHRVDCRRALRILKRALATLTRGPRGQAQVGDFACHLRPHAQRHVACRHGGRRVLSSPKAP